MQTIIVDMTPGYRMPTIYFSQGDVGTQFAIDLRSRFGDSLPASPTVTIQATKPSGFGFTVAATSLTNGVAVFTTTAEMTDEAGRFPAELKVVKDNVTLFSANFGMEGEANTHPAGTIDGSQETVIPELTQLVERAEDAASSVLDRQTVTNTLPAGSQATYSFDEGTNTQTFGIPQGEAGAGAAGVTASAYSASKTYAVGDYVIHNSNLYRCTTAITTAESFTAAHWTQVVLADDVSDVKSDLNDKFGSLALLENTLFNIQWEHGGIDNATGATNNNGSLVRSRDVTYYKVSDFFSITNKAGGALWIIFYTKSGGTYTFASSQSVSINNSYYFDLPSISNYYFRLDCRDGLAGAELVELIYTTKLVNRLIFERYNEIPQKENLFDKNAVTSDSYIRSTDGHIGTNEGYFASDFIPVKKGVTYYTGGFYASYTALYDLSKKFLSGNVITGEGNLGLFTPSEDGYFRGTVINVNYLPAVYVSSYYRFYKEYKEADYSVASRTLVEESELSARGEQTPNLFTGKCYYGEINTSTGKESFGYNKIITDYIPIQGIAFYKLFNGKTGDIVTIYEYDSDKAFINYHSLTTKPIGYRILDANTRFIRFSSFTASVSYDLPDLVEMAQNLLVTNDIKVLGRLATNHNITGQESVRYDLFDKSIAFEKSYVKSAIETYRNTLRDTFYDFVMPMNTDLHTIDSEPYNMLTYMAESGTADICINLGDNVPDHFDTRAETVAMLEAVRLWNSSNNQKCELLVLRGNHDNNPTTGNDVSKMIPDSLYYNIFQHRTKKGFYKVGLNYGFLDFEQSKIRVIWLDSGDIYNHTTGEPLTSGYNVMVQQDQFDWFCDVALDFSNIADRDEWSVITVSHAQISSQLSEAFAVVLKAFMDGATASGSASTAYGDYTNTLTYNVDYSTQGSMEYICHINGHTHDDTASLIGNTGRYDIDIACDNGTAYYYVGTTRTAYTRTAGTIEEHIMDTLCLDKINRKIYMKRLGVGSDREFSY